MLTIYMDNFGSTFATCPVGAGFDNTFSPGDVPTNVLYDTINMEPGAGALVIRALQCTMI